MNKTILIAALALAPHLFAQSPAPSASASAAPPQGPSREAAWNALTRNGMITYSMEASADGARSPEYAKKLSNDGRRKVFIRKSLPGDADLLRGLTIRQYDRNWGVLNRFPVARYQALPPSAEGGDQQVAAGDLVTDYMGSYLRYMDLSNGVDQTAYAAQRQAYFDFIKNHLKHRYATGLVGPLLHPAAAGGPALLTPPSLLPADLFNAAKQNDREYEFVVPDTTKIRRDGDGFRYAADSFAKKYTYRNWTIEFLFQKKSSWPELDRTVIEAAGSQTAPRRSKNGPDYWGWWLSPARYETGHPSGAVDAFDTFLNDEGKWNSVKGSGLYDVATTRNGQTLDVLNPAHYSTVWGPADNEYYFDPGHQRADLSPVNDLWFQYQCHVLVKVKGEIEVSGSGPSTTYECGPYYHSDLFYVEMYATEKTVPETLEEARQVYGERYAYAYAPPLDGAGARRIDTPDEARNLFADPGTPDALATPAAYYPGQQLDFKTALPETFRDDANVFYKTGADTQSLIRFPPRGTIVPDTMPQETKTAEGMQAFLDRYYTNYAVYYPPVTVDGVNRGPWLVNLTEPAERGLAHPYSPERLVPGSETKWKAVVYRPARFTGALADVVDYLYTRPRGTVIAGYGADGVPGGFKFAMKGAVWAGHPVFEIPTRQTDYKLGKGALPVPVGYQTMHGEVRSGDTVRQVIAGADVQMADAGTVGPNETQAQTILPKMRDNYAYAAVTISAGCCGTVTQRLIDKKVGVAFQPRSNVLVTLTDPQSKTDTSAKASIETLGLWQDATLATGVPPLPYDPASVASRAPANYAYAGFKNNFATVKHDALPPGAPGDLLRDARGKSPLEAQLTYFAGQSYDIRVAGDPATGPSVVEMDPAGNQTPGQQHVYYCSKKLSVKVVRVEGSQRTVVKDLDLTPPPLDSGPFAGLSTEPPFGTIKMEFPKEGDYDVELHFEDCNGVARDTVSRVKVQPKGFVPQLVGEEHQRK